ncbi:glycosyltransferase [Rhodoferax sp. GW822-FHT02A01]|uniref:glycosyltransferase n=1 Tax=Rhodoferax sp. GW822-FHT02A01 TaxID=3141537 RepID=UPI00315C7A05
MIKGINFFGPFGVSESIGDAAELDILCLRSAGISYDLYKLSRPTPKDRYTYSSFTPIDDHLISSLKYRINLFHINPRRVPLYFSRLGEDSLKGFYNIGFWVHDMQDIPSLWARQLQFFEEIWTPSSHFQNAVSKSSNIPVLKVPYPIEKQPLSERMKRISEGNIFSSYNFLSIWDVYADAERKNPLFVIRAFLNAHAGNSSVRLIMKTRNLTLDPSLADKLRQIVKDHSNISIIDGYLDEAAMDELYAEADAYVSLHRAEGFGLTISDAMSRGIPVIVTGYSGNMDFCNTDTRLVAYTLREVGHNRSRFRREDVWAEPDLGDATDAFSELVEDHVKWVRKAARARLRIEQEFSVREIGEIMRARIDLISKGFSFHDDMSDREIDLELEIFSTYGF